MAPSARPISFSTIHILFLLPLVRVRVRVGGRFRVGVRVSLTGEIHVPRALESAQHNDRTRQDTEQARQSGVFY
jgi:hypothetical protein